MMHGKTKLKFFFMFLLSALANFTQNSRNLMALSMTYKQYRLCDLNIVLEKREPNECPLITKCHFISA
jgi:hypothetical protein